jgi:hypothetical protein
MSISLTVNKFFDPVMNLAKSSLAKIYQVLPAPAQKFFLGITTTKASPKVLKSLHADVSASEHAKALSKELNRLFPEEGYIGMWCSKPLKPGPYGIPNAIQTMLTSNPLPEKLKAKFKEQGLNIDEYINMALNPTHTGLVVKIPPNSDNPEGLLFIHIDFSFQKPSKDNNFNPFNGELKIVGMKEFCERASDYSTNLQFFKVGKIKDTKSFLPELQEMKKELHYSVPTLFSRGVQILGNEKLKPAIKNYLDSLIGRFPKEHLDNLRNSLLNIRLPAFPLHSHDSENNFKAIESSEKTQGAEEKVGKIPRELLCSDLVSYYMLSKINLDAAFRSVESQLRKTSQSSTPTDLYNICMAAVSQNGKAGKNISAAYSFA